MTCRGPATFVAQAWSLRRMASSSLLTAWRGSSSFPFYRRGNQGLSKDLPPRSLSAVRPLSGPPSNLDSASPLLSALHSTLPWLEGWGGKVVGCSWASQDPREGRGTWAGLHFCLFCSLHLVGWIVSLGGAGSQVLFWSHSIWEAEQLLGYS